MQPQKIFKNKNGHYFLIRGTIDKEVLTEINIYTPIVESAKYVKFLLTTKRNIWIEARL